jgi:hypothetical protein
MKCLSSGFNFSQCFWSCDRSTSSAAFTTISHSIANGQDSQVKELRGNKAKLSSIHQSTTKNLQNSVISKWKHFKHKKTLEA